MDSCIVKIVTDKGVRLGVDYTAEVPSADIVEANLTFKQAQERVVDLTGELGIPEFDNMVEDFLGYKSENPLTPSYTFDIINTRE